MRDIAKAVVFAGIFLVPFIPLVVTNSMFFPFITGKNFAFRIIVELIFAAWVIWMLYEPAVRPRWSWITGGFAVLLIVMFFANLFGEYPLKSFWSNFERMEGYVTIVHVALYFLVVGSVLTAHKLWDRFFNTTLFAASLMALFAFSQLAGLETINQGGWRLDGRLGNATYMAIYMLFHVFIAALMFTRARSRNLQYTYGFLVLLFAFLLFQTVTRGTIIGLAGGVFVSAAYIALFAKGHPNVKKTAAGALIAVVAAVGLLVVFQDSPAVQESRYLKRVTNISLEALEVRFTIWGMAMEGFKERPILGWGQGNFNYVFNEQYQPELYAQEQWFDRVHNIVMDWLIAGGILGFLAYLTILLSAVYYIFIQPFMRREEEQVFTVTERGLLLGLLAGYTAHNLVVFDNIVSYIFFATILAFIHQRVATPMPSFQNMQVNPRVIEQVAAPVVAVALVGAVYFVNVPHMLAARDIIQAFQAQSPEVTLAEFDEALARGSFGDQEIREQLTQQTQNIIRAQQVPAEIKQQAFERTQEELLKQAEEKPGDARVHVFIASFYRFTGGAANDNLELATEHLKIARSLSPNKQQIILEQGLVELQKQNPEEALAFFKEAYELETENLQARTFYAAAALFAGQRELVDELITTDRQMQNFATNNLALQAAHQANASGLLKEMFEIQIEQSPNDPQLRVNLAVLYQEEGNTERAVEILEKAGEDIPSFAEQSEQFIEDLRAGRKPGQPEVSVEGQAVEARTLSQ